MKTFKIETYLPLFKGFYCNPWTEDNEALEIEHCNQIREENGLNEIDPNLIEFDYKEYYERISMDICNEVENKLEDYITAITYQKLVSPKYYNYQNDSINVEVELSEKDLEKIRTTIKENYAEFEAYIKDRYTSSSGFVSSYPNDAESWLEVLKIDSLKSNGHYLGAFLDFIVIVEEIKEEEIYEIESMCIFEVKNIDDVENKETCEECKQFVGNCLC